MTSATAPAFAGRRDIRHNGVVKTAEPWELQERTRDRVARLLLELGSASASTLSERLGLTPAAIRRHLDAMLADGTITAREAVKPAGLRGRGRPARLYALSEAGRAAFPHAYDDLATHALRFLAQSGGPEAVAAFARDRVADLEERLRAATEGVPAEERADALAIALTDSGYVADTTTGPRGIQLCQHHCPVAHVAAEFPQLCEAETGALERVLGRHVQRLATIAHGDGVCTTYIPDASSTPAPGGTPA